jgi:16S rRNA (cytidine1402-2'-O)-methyltransferase
MLHLVGTPIGNMDDISFRAVKALQSADLILAEDTRRTGKLLKTLGIENKLRSYHDHNKEKITPSLIAEMKEGRWLALVTDSGTPGISDPGFYIVRECIRNEIEVTSIPGPCAFISALVCSGLPTDRFSFLGFLPKTSGKRMTMLSKALARKETIILYESPHRIEKLLRLLNDLTPDREIVIARELTKKFEEYVRGTASEILAMKKNIKGEITVVISA